MKRTLALFTLRCLVLCHYFVAAEDAAQHERGDAATALLAQSAITTDEVFTQFLEAQSLLPEQSNACPPWLDASVIAQVVQNGHLTSAKVLVQSCVEKGIKLDDGEVQKEVNSFRKRLTQLTSYIQSSKQEVSHVFPALEWAQSRDSIFISVKFAHKLDTPACIDVVEDKAEFSERGVKLTAVCKGKNKIFSLDLDVLKSIDHEGSTWAMTSVGRGLLTLKKAEHAKWVRLLKSRERVKNMHVWWSLQEKYEDELKKLVEEIEANKTANKAAAEQETKTEDTTTTAEDNTASVEEPEVDEKEEQKAREKKLLLKKMNKEKKKLRKQKAKDEKKLDKELKEKKNELDEENKKAKQQLTEIYEDNIKQLEIKHQQDLEQLDKEENDSPGLIDKITSMFSNDDAKEL